MTARSRQRGRRLALIAAIVLLLGALSAGATAWWAWQQIARPYRGADAATTIVVEPGQGASAILAELERDGLLRDARVARAYLVYHLGDPPLKAGEYRFEAPQTVPEVLDRLIRGEVVTHPVTLIEGLTLDQVADRLVEAGFGEPAEVHAEVRRAELIRDLDPEARDLEGYLYPDTYHFARGTPPSEVVGTLVRTFRERFERQVAPLVEGERTVRELVTLASIVERETSLDEERPVVAGVYANRLRIGMALYADPTVIYGLERRGTWNGNLRRPDLADETNPYNTYVHPGLPPGPICSPAVASLIAAAAPAETDYLYFVSRNDGSHEFASSLAEHNRNVHRWQKLYWNRRWAEERRAAGGS